MTAQASEKLFYKGEKLQMCSTPLDKYLSSSGRGLQFQDLSTACWRGYIGSWEVRGDRLYIIGISAYLDEGREATLEDLFPGYPDGAFAHWFTGEVRCPMGKQLEYIHMGFASKFERDLFLKFKAGVLIAERIVENGKSDRENAPTAYSPGAWISYPPKTKGEDSAQ